MDNSKGNPNIHRKIVGIDQLLAEEAAIENDVHGQDAINAFVAGYLAGMRGN